MTIAVTAVSGQLGREIVNALRTSGVREPVIGLARSPDKARELGIEVRPGDYSDPEQLTASLEGVDTLLLVSGMAPPDERIGQHRNVIDAAVSTGVKKIVYTSIQGPAEGTGFPPIVRSNRQTEKDLQASGLDWVIGRNGVYIEPDIEAMPDYEAHGEITNCAGEGSCGYTTRPELAHAYAQMLTHRNHDQKTYRLHGEPLTQARLAEFLNRAFGTRLSYRSISVDEYREDRTAALGPFLGGVIAGIYEGIREGAFDQPSDFEAAAGRPHRSWDDYFESIRV